MNTAKCADFLTATARCAVYARFSSDRQKPTSIDDQVRKCREYAARAGWTVVDVFEDRATSGVSAERDGLKALLAGAMATPRRFDCIVVDDTSRIARNLADALRFYERLAYVGVRVVAVSQGVDTASSSAKMMLGVHGLMDSLYSEELAKKTHRGMEGALLRGTATGGRCFGYRTNATSGKLEVFEPEASTVRRIFELSADGLSLKKIAQKFNAEGVTSPQPYRGQTHASWAASALSVILRNERYRGEHVWNKTRGVRNPESGRKVSRVRPESEWLRRPAPELRIVSDAVWTRVQTRLEQMRSRAGLWLGGRRKQHLMSGLLRCGVCGTRLTIRGGGKYHRMIKYVCPLAERGVCKFTSQIPLPRLEDRFKEELTRWLESPITRALVEETARRAAARAAAPASSGSGAETREQLKGKIDKLADCIANGNHSEVLLAKLRDMEARYQAMRPVRAAAPAASTGVSVPALEAVRKALRADDAKLKALLLQVMCVIRVNVKEGKLAGEVWVGGGGPNQTHTSRRPSFTLPLAA